MPLFAFLESINWFINTPMLPNKSFPIIFHSMKGVCERAFNSYSYINKPEANVVLNYISKIADGVWNGIDVRQSDIGVVSPYSKQCDTIRKMCADKSYNDITVGTAEVFQGQEKPIMVVSTVRQAMANSVA